MTTNGRKTDFENMHVLKLVRMATFEEFQALTTILNNPKLIKAMTRALKEWDYKETEENNKRKLDDFRNKKGDRQKSINRELYNEFLFASKSSLALFPKKRDYRDILGEIETEIKTKHHFSTDKEKTLLDIENNINQNLLDKALKL